MSWESKLIQLRRAKGWTQAELAERVGVTPRTVRWWESGNRMPRLNQAAALARVLGVDLGVLQPPQPQQEQVHANWQNKLIRFRRGKAWSQAELAAKVGVTLRVIQNWEAGRLPRLDDATRLADALGVSLDDLRTHDKPTIKVKTETLAQRMARKKAERLADEILNG